MSSFVQSGRIFLHLVHRDSKVLRARWKKILIDNVISISVFVLVYGHLFPAMGMGASLIGPMFIGSSAMSFFQLGFGLSIKFVQDLKFNRYIDYQVALPLKIEWLFFSYIINFMIEAILVTLPMLVFGIFLLGNKFVIVHTSWFLFGVIYLLTTFFFATLFLWLSFASEYSWFWANVWPRRLEPLFLFGAVFVPWKPLYAFSPFLGIVFLLNPVTHMVEGLRTTLIGGDQFLPFWVCSIGTLCGIAITVTLLVVSVRKRLL